VSARWTGGQYSVVRAVLGIYLVVHFACLLPYGAEVFSSHGVLPDASQSPLIGLFPNILAVWDAPPAVSTLLVIALLASVALAVGTHDRAAALVVAYVWACLYGRNPLISNPSLPYVGWLLVAHACVPGAPYGAWRARGRADPGGGWSFPRGVYVAAWIAMAVGYSYSGAMKLASPSWLDGSAIERILANPLTRPGLAREWMLELPSSLLRALTYGALAAEIAFAPLALARRLRPWLWAAMLAMHVSLMALIDFADLSFGMLCLHLFTFDPAWIPARRAAGATRVFYDGHCGLCHGFVRFVLAEDSTGETFRLSPLQGETVASVCSQRERAALPDSLVVVGRGEEPRVRSAAVLYVLDRLGGLWRVAAFAVRVVPSGLRDALYDLIARWRLRIFARPEAACPLVPRHLASRFEP